MLNVCLSQFLSKQRNLVFPRTTLVRNETLYCYGLDSRASFIVYWQNGCSTFSSSCFFSCEIATMKTITGFLFLLEHWVFFSGLLASLCLLGTNLDGFHEMKGHNSMTPKKSAVLFKAWLFTKPAIPYFIIIFLLFHLLLQNESEHGSSLHCLILCAKKKCDGHGWLIFPVWALFEPLSYLGIQIFVVEL